MKVLIDTNIIIDFLCRRDIFFDDAKIVFEHCFTDADGVIAGHTISNLFYILRHRYDFTLEQCRNKIRNLCILFDVADINKKTILKALDNEDFTDLEDSMQNECAVSSGVDYIVTRNGTDFKSEKIPAVTPKEFIEIVRKRPRQ